tara:strand:- start:264 stop:1433 length:1170 start_codon:yes stop_codon:yes gene_type:complete
MSTLKVDGIRSNGDTSGNDAITLADNNTCTANITNRSNRNKIVNGAMRLSQRGTTFSPTAQNQIYTLDRFEHVTTTGVNGDCTVTQSTDSPDGFLNSYKVTPDSDDTPSAGGNVTIRYQAEGQDLQDLAYGTSSAKSITLSFYAKTASANSGDQYALTLFYARNDGTTKTILKSFTPTSTWQRFSFTIAGDTDANYGIRNDNETGITITWVLAAGPNDITSAMDTWTVDGGYFRGVTGHDNFMDNTSNEFYLTGVQLEVGSVATDFEHKLFTEDQAQCHRYYYQIAPPVAESLIGDSLNYDTSDHMTLRFPVEMRIEPSFICSDFSNAFRIYGSSGGRNVSTLSVNTGVGSTKCILIECSGGTNGSQNFVRIYNANSGVYATIAADAEI